MEATGHVARSPRRGARNLFSNNSTGSLSIKFTSRLLTIRLESGSFPRAWFDNLKSTLLSTIREASLAARTGLTYRTSTQIGERIRVTQRCQDGRYGISSKVTRTRSTDSVRGGVLLQRLRTNAFLGRNGRRVRATAIRSYKRALQRAVDNYSSRHLRLSRREPRALSRNESDRAARVFIILIRRRLTQVNRLTRSTTRRLVSDRLINTSGAIFAHPRCTMRVVAITLRLRGNVSSVFRRLEAYGTALFNGVTGRSGECVALFYRFRRHAQALTRLNGETYTLIDDLNVSDLCQVGSGRL